MDARESCLPDLLINQAKKTPDALAIVCGHERISYWELDQATDSLGAYLRHQAGYGAASGKSHGDGG